MTCPTRMTSLFRPLADLMAATVEPHVAAIALSESPSRTV